MADNGRGPAPETKLVELPEGMRKGGDVIDDSTPPAARPHQMLDPDQAQPAASQIAPESGGGSGGEAE